MPAIQHTTVLKTLKIERRDWFRFFAAILTVGVGMFLMNSYWVNTLRPGLARFEQESASDWHRKLLGIELETAKEAVQESVQSQLKSPSTAKFLDKWDIVALPHDHYRFTSTVDSQNGFGAMLRSRFVAVVDLGPNRRVEKLRFY